MGGSDWAAIVVGLISVISAIFSGRAARQAAKVSSDAEVTSTKIQAETEAYNRARQMDVKTIEMQDEQIEELRIENQKIRTAIARLREENEVLHEDNDRLRRRIARLEQLQQGDG